MTTPKKTTINKLGLCEAITDAIDDHGFTHYEDTWMLVSQGLEGWDEDSLIEKAKEFSINIKEFEDVNSN